MSMSTSADEGASSSRDNNLLKEVIDDIISRFLTCVPTEYRKDTMRIFFEIEYAHWFYLDHYYNNAEFPYCRKLPFRDFTKMVFQQCDYLKSRSRKWNKYLDEFRAYKMRIPVNGAIIIDESCDYVLLVQGYYASSNSWGFPKGKINEDEDTVQCAIREVVEEVGYDVSGKIRRDLSLSKSVNKTATQLYLVPGVALDAEFEPHVNKEIRKIQWFKIDCLPRDRGDFLNPGKIGRTPNNFYNVIPFVNDILQFVNEEKEKRSRSTVTTPQPTSFTGISFLQHFTEAEKTQAKPPTVLVYAAARNENAKKPPPVFPCLSSGESDSVSIDGLYDYVSTPPSSPNGTTVNSSTDFIPSTMTCDEATASLATILGIKQRPDDHNIHLASLLGLRIGNA